MKIFIFLLLIITATLLIIQLKKLLLPYHVYSITIHKSYNQVWEQLSDPLNYKKLYPYWIKEISLKQDNQYEVNDQFGHTYNMILIKDINHGLIKLQIGNELSITQIVPLDEHNTLVTHIAKKWQGINTINWILHKRTVANDFNNAKKVIEKNL